MNVDETPLDNALLSDLINLLGRYKFVRNTLSSLSRIADTRVRELEAAAIPAALEQGMTKIPNELLAHIIEATCEDGALGASPSSSASSCDAAICLSHVCRRWRELSFKIPGLWTKLGCSMTKSQLDAFLQRSKNAGLDIDLAGSEECRLDCLLDTITPHSTKWRSLRVDCTTLRSTRTRYAKLASCHLDLEALGSLSLIHPDATETFRQAYRAQRNGDEFNAVSDLHIRDEFHFYESWNVPNLRRLSTKDMMPRAHLATALVSCELEFSSSQLREWDMVQLVDFLNASYLLKQLSLRFADPRIGNTSCHETKLLKLEYLSLAVTGYALEENFRNFMQGLEAPLLSEARFTLSLSANNSAFRRWLDGLVPHPAGFPLLSKLSLSLSKPCQNDMSCPLGNIFERLHALEHLSIEATNFATPDKFEGDVASPLEALRLKRCNRFSTPYVAGFLKKLNKFSERSAFAALEIVDCPELDGGYLQEIVARREMIGCRE